MRVSRDIMVPSNFRISTCAVLVVRKIRLLGPFNAKLVEKLTQRKNPSIYTCTQLYDELYVCLISRKKYFCLIRLLKDNSCIFKTHTV